jgi:hypothetical protein
MYINDVPRHSDPSSFKLGKLDRHINDADLQRVWPNRFVVCKTEQEAKDAAAEAQHAYICRLFDYSPKDIVPFGSMADDSGKRTQYRPREGARKIYTGWLVSFPSLRQRSESRTNNMEKSLSNL